MNTCVICNKQYNKSRSNGDRGDLCGSCCVTWNRYLLKKKSIEYKGGKCNNCGYNKCDTALTFHHLDPSQKEFGISSVNISRKWETTKKELDKCILLCLLCHAEEHEKLSNRQKLINYKLQKEKESATIKHGIRSTYINYKCRCEECKRSQAEAMREYKRKKRHA